MDTADLIMEAVFMKLFRSTLHLVVHHFVLFLQNYLQECQSSGGGGIGLVGKAPF